MRLRSFLTVLGVCGLLGFGLLGGGAAPCVAEVLSPQRTLPGEASTVPETRKSAVLISLIGKRMLGITRGIGSIKVDTMDVDWGIDRLILQQLATTLADTFYPRTVDVDWSAVIKASFMGRSLFSGADELVDALRKTVQPGTVDLIIVVRHSAIADPFGGSNTSVGGYGVFVTDGLFGRDNGRAYLVCSIVAIDGTRMKEIGERLCLGTGGFLEPAIPFRKLDEPMTKAKLGAYDQAQLAWLREALQAMVAETVPRTLAKLELTRELSKGDAATAERPSQEQSTR